MQPKHLVRVIMDGYEALYPARTSVGLRRIMRALQKERWGRTKVFTWNSKAKAYLS